MNDWLGRLSPPSQGIVAGNHGIVFRDEPEQARSLLTNAHYLENSDFTLEGFRFWGSPITRVIGSMACAISPGMFSRAVCDLVPSL